jgi:CarD family transcriptional regulator
MWIDNDKQREQKYKEAIHSCEPEKLVSIIKNMYNRKLIRTAQGKKNTAVDDRYFKLAENNLYTELAFAMEKDKDDMQLLITNRMQEIQ